MLSLLLLPFLSLLGLASSQALGEPPGDQVLFAVWANPFETGTSPYPVDVNAALGVEVPLFLMSQYIPVLPVDPTTGIGGAIRADLIEATNSTAGIYLTVYPNNGGFANVTQQDLDDLADQIASYKTPYNRTVFLRYAPEMQGTWNEYGEQPAEFLVNWVVMYNTIKAKVPDCIIIWGPNTGQGYPWGQAGPTNATDLALLDTNGDGVLDSGDNAYSPYWPGEQYVDWMGISVYYKGADGGENNDPQTGGYCAGILTGDNGGELFTNFYETYCTNYTDKACMLTESGGAYHDNLTGSDQLTMMSTWFQDCITNTTFLDEFPRLKIITQFEFAKTENPGSDEADYQDHRLTNNTEVVASFKSALDSMGTRFLWASTLTATTTTASVATTTTTTTKGGPVVTISSSPSGTSLVSSVSPAAGSSGSNVLVKGTSWGLQLSACITMMIGGLWVVVM